MQLQLGEGLQVGKRGPGYVEVKGGSFMDFVEVVRHKEPCSSTSFQAYSKIRFLLLSSF